jgi:beta-1,4-mannosyl-glycoprotein beta-1,4-N-acetylglucosaminyltransferase
MKVFDCFTFFNELDLLEFRLKLLDPCVDHFVIAESNITHSGKPKPYHFEEAKDRFKKWQQKIIYLPVRQSAEGMVFEEQKSYNPGSAAWKLENGQRNALLGAASYMKDNDLVLLSDLDEIPGPAAIKKAAASQMPLVFSLLFHYYYLNCQHAGNERWWNGTIASTGKQFRETTPQDLRDKRNELSVVKKAGWHFSYLGGSEKIKQKIRSFAHTEFNKEEFLNDENIRKAIEEGKDIFNRPGVNYQFVSLYYYPRYLRKIMRQYPQLLYLKTKDSLPDKMYFAVRNLFR